MRGDSDDDEPLFERTVLAKTKRDVDYVSAVCIATLPSTLRLADAEFDALSRDLEIEEHAAARKHETRVHHPVHEYKQRAAGVGAHLWLHRSLLKVRCVLAPLVVSVRV